MQYMPWLQDRRGILYNLHGAGFSCVLPLWECAVMVINTAWSAFLLALCRYGNKVDSEATTLWVFLSCTRLQLFLHYGSSASEKSLFSDS